MAQKVFVANETFRRSVSSSSSFVGEKLSRSATSSPSFSTFAFRHFGTNGCRRNVFHIAGRRWFSTANAPGVRPSRLRWFASRILLPVYEKSISLIKILVLAWCNWWYLVVRWCKWWFKHNNDELFVDRTTQARRILTFNLSCSINSSLCTVRTTHLSCLM